MEFHTLGRALVGGPPGGGGGGGGVGGGVPFLAIYLRKMKDFLHDTL